MVIVMDMESGESCSGPAPADNGVARPGGAWACPALQPRTEPGRPHAGLPPSLAGMEVEVFLADMSAARK